jgi:hypothetical protein
MARFNKGQVALLFFLFFAFSCKKKDSDLGLNLRSDNGLIDAIVVDTFKVIAYTVKQDSLRTDSLNSNTLGAINDPVFGTSVASLHVNFKLDELGFDFGPTPKFDSIILSMVHYNAQDYYGDTNSTIKLNIYRLDEKLVSANKYFSNYQFSKSDLIDTWEGEFGPTDSAIFTEKGKVITGLPQLRIKLDQNFGQSFIDNAPGIFTSQETFDDFLNGIAIVPDASGLAIGQGVIAPFLLTSIHSNLTLYYNDSLIKEFNINNSADRVNTYELSNWSADISNQLSNPGVNSPQVYVQSMGGLKAKIEIPELFDLVKDGNRIMINEAKITFQIEPGSDVDGFVAPDRMLMFVPSQNTNTDSVFIDLRDAVLPPNSAWVGRTNYGGSRDGDSYTFHFNRYLQELLDDYLIQEKNGNRGFYLTIPSDNPITPTRMILGNDPNEPNKKIKLKITYTKL